MASTFKNRMNASVGTSNVTCYSAPLNAQAVVVGLIIVNKQTVDINVDCYLADYSNGNTITYLANNVPIPYATGLVIAGKQQKIVLKGGDRLDVKSSLAASADVTVSILEIT